ncbi:F-box/kelch-repeat protein At1g15670-like [Tasmannia lanceolata]|uniref:F-box/kelch-repeat protein At1g15670-like n=1 Tax=Tasmannia lanceolata TaxID=3420 RepID=UPI0040629CE0
MTLSNTMELIPTLPEEIGMECLVRLPYTCHPTARRVSRTWKKVIDGGDFYDQRKKSGNTQMVACLVQSLPSDISSDGLKPVGPPAYGISVFDMGRGEWERLKPIPKYPKGLPLFCQVVGIGRKLVVIGGWDPSSWEPICHVYVYDFTTREWAQGKDMPGPRSFFAAGAIDGRILIAGGHDESKNALRSAFAYSVERDEWEEMDTMGEERDECEGVVIGGQFWVVSGYSTDRQGNFSGSAEVFDPATGRWRNVERCWDYGRCPRACVGVAISIPPGEGKLVCWSEEEPAVRVGACAVRLGGRALLMGSVCPGAPHGFYLVELRGGQKGKLERVDMPEEFSGFVQSGCCVEI